MSRLVDKSAIVTGGASGLGRAIAERFVEEGASVTITDIDPAQGQDTAAAIGAVFMQQDVSDEARWQAVMSEVVERSGGLHVLVNNAGICDLDGEVTPELISMAAFQRTMAVNVGGVMLGCKYAIPAMAASGGGSIINLASIAALVATPFATTYGASKAAVWQLSKSVAIHCAQQRNGVRCNTIHPGQVMTAMLRGLIEEMSRTADLPVEAMREEFLKKIPMGEFGEAEDIANAALFLACHESKHITGQELVVDGGIQYCH